MKIAIKLLISIICMISNPVYSTEAKICFYAFADFDGKSFCAAESESKSIYHYDDDFDHGIASISVPPGMVITLYTGTNFSGTKKTFKNDINLQALKSSGFYQKIGSYQVEPAICFYTEDQFQGDSTCLSSNQQIDFYHDSQGIVDSERHVLLIRNDSTKSIKIPQRMMATIYKNDDFNIPFFKLTESANDEDLKALGMHDDITGVRASKSTDMSCDQQCVIISDRSMELSDAFGQYWDDDRLPNKQVLFVFSSKGLGEDDNYSISLFDGPNISIIDRQIIFSDQKMINKFSFDRYKHIDKLSFIIQIKNGTVQTQYVQTLNNQLIDISPIISFEWLKKENENPVIELANYNVRKPLVLAKTILTADTGNKHWGKRDLTQTSQIICAFIPFLNIYNYLTQGKCQQLDGIVFNAAQYFSSSTKGKTLHIAGNSPPLKQEASSTIEMLNKDDASNFLSLTYIDNTKQNQSLSLPAAAKTCMVSIYSLLNARQTRQIRPNCIDWTLDIMTDFTLLFGQSLETWNSEYFSRIVDSIIRTGSSGVAVENQEVEKRFSQAIKEKVTQQNTENELGHIKTAFDYAQLSYLTYSFYYTSDDTPAVVELLPLGIYELLLETFIYVPTHPVIMTQGEPVEQPELEFEVEILPTLPPEEEQRLSDAEIKNAQAMRKKLSETIAQWGQQYQGAHFDQSTSDEDSGLSKTLHAGHIVTGIIHRRLMIHRPGEIYVIVKLRGRIIAVVLADRFNSRDEVELVASATQPEYVLFPNREGTVRGAGTTAVRELARYLQQQGARTLFSEVISQPSARVKQKVGFNFRTEF